MHSKELLEYFITNSITEALSKLTYATDNNINEHPNIFYERINVFIQIF